MLITFIYIEEKRKNIFIIIIHTQQRIRNSAQAQAHTTA